MYSDSWTKTITFEETHNNIWNLPLGLAIPEKKQIPLFQQVVEL